MPCIPCPYPIHFNYYPTSLPTDEIIRYANHGINKHFEVLVNSMTLTYSVVLISLIDIENNMDRPHLYVTILNTLERKQIKRQELDGDFCI